MTNKFFDPAIEAREILTEHTVAHLTVTYPEIAKMSLEDMFDDLYEGIGYVLSEYFAEGKYSIKEYFEIRNELAKLLSKLWEREKEEK
jgi:hypothetical protein